MKYAIITGAASGLGRELAIQLANQQYELMLWDIQKDPLQSVAQELSAQYQVVDMGIESAISAAFQDFQEQSQHLHLFINCAGISITGAAVELTPLHWNRIIDINLKGAILGATYALQIMKDQGYGQIVNIASIFGLLPAPSAIAYSTSKHALVGFSKTLAIEARSYGVEIYTICPGFIQSALFQNATYVGVCKDMMLQKTPTTIPVQDAALRIIQGIKKKQSLQIFPFSAKILFYLERYWPWLSRKILQQSWKDFQNLPQK